MANPLNPPIPKGQFALIQSEVQTGLVPGLDGKKFFGQGREYLLFDSLSSATEKAKEVVRSNPEIECWIRDHQNQNVATLRHESQPT